MFNIRGNLFVVSFSQLLPNFFDTKKIHLKVSEILSWVFADEFYNVEQNAKVP